MDKEEVPGVTVKENVETCKGITKGLKGNLVS